MTIALDPEAEKRVLASIRRYFAEFQEEEIGELKSRMLLDFVLKEIGPCVYNRAIVDARAFFQERVADLEGSCYEPQFTYWDKRPE